MKKIFEFLIGEDDDTGIKTISLVESPAIESDFIAFNSEEKVRPKYISLESEEGEYKGIVAGLSLIPDKLIYRVDPETKEDYYGYFSQDTIEKIRNKYHKEMMTSSINLDHEDSQYINAFLVESYLLDTETRVEEVKAKGIEEATLGAWYTAFKIEDEEVFQRVLEGDFKGFSIEAFLNKELKSIDASLKNNLKEKETKMKKTLVENLKEKFNTFLESLDLEDEQGQKFESALVPEEGFTINWTEVGEAVTRTLTQEDGEEITEPIGQGEFVIEDGRTIVVSEDSTLIEVRDAEGDGEGEPEEENSDKSKDEDLENDKNEKDVKASEDKPKEDLEEGDGEGESDKKSDLDKSLRELLDLSKNGEYSVMVSVYDGKVEYGSISAWTEIKMKADHDKEVEELNNKIKDLEEKLSEPITDPQLTDVEDTKGEVRELSVYERIAKRKGIPTV